MSRIRIVGGTITKTTTGAHHMYSEENIVFSSSKMVTEVGEENGVVYGEPKDAPKVKKIKAKTSESKDFDITLELDKKSETVVPFGIKDYKQNEENQFFKFKLKVSGDGINNWQLDIKGKNGMIYTCYSATQELQEVVITSKRKKGTVISDKSNSEATSSPSFWPAGDYIICWDGFDNNDIYDSALFNGEKLEAKITGTKEGKQKNATIDFSAEYNQVQWTDVKIDRNAKRIDVTLRVNFTDGGAEGLNCWNNTRNFNPPHTKPQICDWDKIPASEIKPNSPAIKTRTRSFQALEKLALEGLNYHWGRNKNHFSAKNITVNNDSYELYINAISIEKDSIGKMELVYNTNGNWMRSGNPGTIKDPLTAAGNIISRQAICYNIGYIYSLDWYEFYKSKKWRYRSEAYEDIDFKFTSAHEIGHEILKKYAGTFYSYGHKDSVNSAFQFQYDDAPEYPMSGEIDIMPYFKDNKLGNSHQQKNYFQRLVASEKDVLGMIWLTKIEIK